MSDRRSNRYAGDDGGDGDDSDSENADDAEETTGTRLTAIPVVESYGFWDFVHLAIPEQDRPVTAATPLLFSSDIAFATLKFPDLPGGGTADYELMFKGGQTRTVSSGSTFDFTPFDADGVRFFRLWASNSDGVVPLTAGGALPDAVAFTFKAEGPTEVWQGVLVPEPSGLVLAVCCAAGLLAAATRRRPGKRSK